MLAPARSRCRLAYFGVLCGIRPAHEGSGKVRRSECPNGASYTSPGSTPGCSAQPERSEGTPHTIGCSRLFCGGRVPGLALGIRVSTGAPRDRSCARRERWGRLSFRAVARGGSGCRRSNACSGPVPLPLGGSVVGLALGVSRGPPGVGPAHLHKRGHSDLFSGDKGQAPNGMVLVRFWVVLCGTGPARAGKLGGGWGFRAVREGEV